MVKLALINREFVLSDKALTLNFQFIILCSALHSVVFTNFNKDQDSLYKVNYYFNAIMLCLILKFIDFAGVGYFVNIYEKPVKD